MTDHGAPIKAKRVVAVQHYTGERPTWATYRAKIVFRDGITQTCPHEGGHRSDDVIRRCAQKIIDDYLAEYPQYDPRSVKS